MRKHVTPALPTASIRDPERADFLPADGRTVAWTPYWALLAARGDVLTSEDPAEDVPAPASPEVPHTA